MSNLFTSTCLSFKSRSGTGNWASPPLKTMFMVDPLFLSSNSDTVMETPSEQECIPSESKRFMSKKWGYLSVIAATLLFGIWNTFNKILLQDLDPIALSAIVYCVAGAFLFTIRFSPINNRIMSFLDADCSAETHISRRDYMFPYL